MTGSFCILPRLLDDKYSLNIVQRLVLAIVQVLLLARK